MSLSDLVSCLDDYLLRGVGGLDSLIGFANSIESNLVSGDFYSFKRNFLVSFGFNDVDFDFLSSLSNLVGLIVYFNDVLGLSKGEQLSVVKKFPGVLRYSVVDDGSETNLRSKVGYFSSVLGINPVELGRIVKKFPGVLSYSVVDDGSETNLRSKVDFYVNDYGFGFSGFRDLIINYPSILGRAIKTNVEPKVYYLRLKSKLDDFKLSTIVTVTTNRFVKMCGDADATIYNQFKSNWVYLTSNRSSNLGLNKQLLDYKRLINYSRSDLERAYNQLVNDGLVNELQVNPNLIFDYC